MADKLMYIPSDDTQSYPFCRLQLAGENFNTQLMNQSINIQKKPPKLLGQRIRICYCKTLGTSGIKSRMSLMDVVIHIFF